MRFPTRPAVPQSKSLYHCDSCLDLSGLRAKYFHLRKGLSSRLLPGSFEEWLAARHNKSNTTDAQVPLPQCKVCRPVYVEASIYQSKSQYHCDSCLHLSDFRAKYLHLTKHCRPILSHSFEKWMAQSDKEFDTSTPLPRCEECRPVYMHISIYRSKSQFHCDGCLYLSGPRADYLHLRAEVNRSALTQSFEEYMVEEHKSGRLAAADNVPQERCEECRPVCDILSVLRTSWTPNTTLAPQSSSITKSSTAPQTNSTSQSSLVPQSIPIPESIPAPQSIPTPELSQVPESNSQWHCDGCSYLIGLRSNCRHLRMGLEDYAKRVGTQSFEEYMAARSRQTTYRLEAGKLPEERCEQCYSIYDSGVFVCDGYSASSPSPSDFASDDIPRPFQQAATAESADKTTLSKSFLRRAVSPSAKRAAATAASSCRSPLSPQSTLKSNRAHGFLSKTKEGSKSGSENKSRFKLTSALKAGLNRLWCGTHTREDYRVLPPRPITPPRQQPDICQGQTFNSFTVSAPTINLQSAPSMSQWTPAAGYSTPTAAEAAVPSIPPFQFIPPTVSNASIHDTSMEDTPMDDAPFTPSTLSPHTTIDANTNAQSPREPAPHYWKTTKGRATFKEQAILRDPKAKLTKFSARVTIAMIKAGNHCLIDDIVKRKPRRPKQQ